MHIILNHDLPYLNHTGKKDRAHKDVCINVSYNHLIIPEYLGVLGESKVSSDALLAQWFSSSFSERIYETGAVQWSVNGIFSGLG